MKHIHLIGIGGSGISAIARLLIEKGYVVSGSDQADSLFLNDLRKLNAKISIGHHSSNIDEADLIVRSSAIPDSNPEVQAAIKKGIPILKRDEFLGQIMEGTIGIGIAGTHGKTTTSSMLAWVLTDMKEDPSFILGGIAKNLNVNAHSGKGDVFVIEADEYDRMFLGLKPKIEVITNVEHDHPDCYPTKEEFVKAFQDYVELLDEDSHLVLFGNDVNTNLLCIAAEKKNIQVHRYGIMEEDSSRSGLNSYADKLSVNKKGGYSFSGSINNTSFCVDLQVPGVHNVLNSLAVLTVISVLNLPIDKASKALGDFKGTERRFEVLGEVNGITIIDDYAHHPTEIQATLEAARARYNNREIWVVWQPHTYSRTRLMRSEFSGSFKKADHVIVTEIYAARENKQDFSAEEVVRIMDHPDRRFIRSNQEVINYLNEKLSPKDVLLVLSAGDANQISKRVLDQLKEKRC